MAKTLFLIFNHQFTPTQERDAMVSLGVDSLCEMPEDLKELWRDIPPELEDLSNYLDPFRIWLKSKSRPGDSVLIQGDFGACYLMVEFALKNDITPVYSTTRRNAQDQAQPDGSIKLIHEFTHVRFRKYGI